MRVISTMCIHMFIANVLVFKGIYVTHLEEGGEEATGGDGVVTVRVDGVVTVRVDGGRRCAMTGVESAQ